jgi:pantetheine-phosphate adenylyltransferase
MGVLTRGARVFGRVRVLVVHNPQKTPLFTSDERIELWRLSLAEIGQDLSQISFDKLDAGLLVDYCRDNDVSAILKGFRTAADIEYELPMAQVNRDLAAIETVFLAAEPGTGFVSSSLVKEVSSLGGDPARYITPTVARALRRKRPN